MKNIKKLIFTIFCFIVLSPNIKANSISVVASSSSVTKGDTVTITVTVSSDAPVVSIEGSLSCSGAGVSGGMDLKFDDSSNSVYTKTYSYKAKTTTTGTLTCSTSGARLTNMSSDNWQSLGSSSKSVTVKAPYVAPPKVYSSNNYLKSLNIEGHQIDFNKETLEYSIEVPNDTEKVNISATVEDSTAKVSGTGEIEVSEGNNEIIVKVTAENGNERKYIINVSVKELDPIYINVGGSKYTIIRKEDVLEVPELYEKTYVNIDGEEVLAYEKENIDFVLIGLKDNEGNANYYAYKDGEYSIYKEYKFNGITLYMTDKVVNIDNYKKTKFSYGDDSLEGYKLNDDNIIKKTYATNVKDVDNFYLFYALNVETGEENLYQYDAIEGTVQRYSSSILNITNNYKQDANMYIIIIIILAIISVTLFTTLIVMIIKNKKKSNGEVNKKSKKEKEKVNEIDF